ncbi:MAG: hypothetical protein JST01_27765 [Cyanobacteria bacterium SZAS TMP-1]|nr:hypothetical protein [Cyanobacteria bacterium SZAS TMP-1]
MTLLGLKLLVKDFESWAISTFDPDFKPLDESMRHACFSQRHKGRGCQKASCDAFFENDPEKVNRNEAFRLFASCHWSEVPRIAVHRWNSGDTATRMAVLNALRVEKSSLFDRLIEEARRGPDESLQIYAAALRLLADLGADIIVSLNDLLLSHFSRDTSV